MRIDLALRHDLRATLRSRPIQLYLLLQVVAAAIFVVRRGSHTASMVVIIWAGILVLAFLAWWAGRHRLAHPQADPVLAAGPRSAFALVGVVGATVVGLGLSLELGMEFGFVLLLVALGGWLWPSVRSGGPRNLRDRLTRDPRPFLPLLVFIGLPRLLAIGAAYPLGVLVALPSGIGQELLFLVGLFAPLEAWSRRPAAAAVISALLFALVHVSTALDINDGDLLATAANTVIFQANVGLVVILAYRRHRAVVPIGVAHALAIG